jgi:Stage II sporulation protein E (SpoIIE)
MRSRGSAWVNAGHPAPLLICDRRVVRALENPGTLPVGFGGATPQISEQLLRRGDRVLFFTDGAIEEHKPGGEQFGQERLIEFVERAGRVGEGVQEMGGLSHSLTRARGVRPPMTRPCSWWNGGVAPLTTSPPWKCYHVARPQTQSVIMRRGGAWRRRRRSDITVSRTLDDLVVAVRRPVQIAWRRAVQMVVTALVVVGRFAGPIFAARARASPGLGAGLDAGSIRGIRLSLPGGLVARSLGSPRGSAIQLPTPIAGRGGGRS